MRLRVVPAIALGIVSATVVFLLAEKLFDSYPTFISRRARVAQFEPVAKGRNNADRIRRGSRLGESTSTRQLVDEVQTRKIDNRKFKSSLPVTISIALKPERTDHVRIAERGTFTALRGFSSCPYRGPPSFIS